MKNIFETFKKLNPKEVLSKKSKELILALSLLAPTLSQAQQEIGVFSQDEVKKQNIEVMGKIFSNSEFLKKEEQAKKDSMAFTGLRFNVLDNFDMNVVPKMPEIGEKHLNYIDIRNYNDELAQDSLGKGIEISGAYMINFADSSKEVYVSGKDTDRDGIADFFCVIDETYDEGYYKKGKKMRIDATKHHYNIDTEGYDINKDYLASRDEVLVSLGEEEGQRVLAQLDQKYNEMLKMASDHFSK